MSISIETIKSVLSECTINDLIKRRGELILAYNAVLNDLLAFDDNNGKVLEWWLNGQYDPVLNDENGLHIPVFPDILLPH